MAMNKSEKARMDTLEHELRKVKALRFPDYVPAKINIAEATTGRDWDTVTVGWAFNVHSLRVWQGWFRATSHGTWPRNPKYNSGSQGCGGPWYVTKRDATMALRIALTDQYAENLANIDRLIEGRADDPD
jgi:hypothetical protein